MHITVAGKQIELSDALHERVWQHLDSVGRRYATHHLTAHVVFSRERRYFTCEITLSATGMQLRDEASDADAYRAFDRAMESITTRLAEARSRRYHHRAESSADIGFRTLLRPDQEKP